MSQIVYLNGRFLGVGEANVSIFDGGWLHGAGLFETMRLENGRVFRLNAHHSRLQASAAKLLRPMEPSELPSPSVYRELAEQNALDSARIRLTVTSGSVSPNGAAEMPSLTVCATAAALASYPASAFDTGVAVVICTFHQSKQDPLAGHKCTSYLARLLGVREAQQARCTEALWFNTENHLAEGSISNVFVVREGVVRTPPLDTPVLPGIARGVVLDLVRSLGIGFADMPLSVDDLLDADEVFLTNSIMQVLPVVRVERHDIRDAKVGPITRQLLAAYRQLVEAECKRS